MMRAIYFLLIFFFFANCSYKKEEAYVPNYEQGYTEVMLNGANWKGEAIYLIDDLIEMCPTVQTIAFRSRNAFGELRRSLSFSNVEQDAVGKFALSNINLNERPCSLSVVFSLLVADGDAGDGSFWLDETKENYIDITHQDDQKIEGNYDLHFIVKDDTPPKTGIHSMFVNGARAENGYFEVFKQ